MPDPKNPNPMLDSDGDGLSDAFERRLGTNPHNKDTDGDRQPDGVEVASGNLPRVRGPVDHGEGWADVMRRHGAEWEKDHRGGRPNADDDNDGIADWIEALRGQNVIDPIPSLTTADDVPNDQPLDVFIGRAMMQRGDPYRRKVEVEPSDRGGGSDYAHPRHVSGPWDSSELVEWAAKQAGVRDMPDGAWEQYRWLRNQDGGEVTVKEALETKGALVFGFSSNPNTSHGRPTGGYVAISVGDGKNVIEVSERSGKVAVVPAGRLYTKAAKIPELHEPRGDRDLDGDGKPDLRDLDGDGYTDEAELVLGGDITRGDAKIAPPAPDGAGTSPPSTTIPPDAASMGSGAATGAGAGVGTGVPSATVPPDAGAMVSPLMSPANPLDPTDPLGAERYQPDDGQASYSDDSTSAPGYAHSGDGEAYTDTDTDSYAATDTYAGDDSSAFGPAGTGDQGSAYSAAPFGGDSTGGGPAYADSGSIDAGQAYGGPGQPGQTYAQAETGSESDDEYVAFEDDPGEAGGEVDAGFYDDTSIA